MRRVLVANRGEITLRIIHACRQAGLETVSVYSAADQTSPHVRAAERAVQIGPAQPEQSYLAANALLHVTLACSCIGKLIVQGRERSEAIVRAEAVLSGFEVEGIAKTIPFHLCMLRSAEGASHA